MKNAEKCAFVLESPYAFGVYRHKVQLHTHTTRSDGRHDPQWVMRAYADKGYAAVAITDHDYRERTMPILEDPGGHPIVHIPGVEYSADAANRSWCHMLGLAIGHIHHAGGWQARESQIDQAAAERGLSFLCHPYGDDVHRRGWTSDEILGVQGYTGIEIYNGASGERPEELSCFSRAVDLALLSSRRIYLISSDDFHQDLEMDRGYIAINSSVSGRDLRLEDVLTALQSGNFFAVGRMDPRAARVPHFTSIDVVQHTVTVTTDIPADIAFITARRHGAADGSNDLPIEKSVSCARYTASRDDRFVRIQVTICEDGRESCAWSNPIYLRKVPNSVFEQTC